MLEIKEQLFKLILLEFIIIVLFKKDNFNLKMLKLKKKVNELVKLCTMIIYEQCMIYWKSLSQNKIIINVRKTI
jgi:hypothetical protein